MDKIAIKAGLILLMSMALSALDIIKMEPIDPLKKYDILEPKKASKPQLTMKKGFSSPIPNLNDVHTIIESDDGFYIAGNTMTAESVKMNFDKKAFAENISPNGFFSDTSTKDVFSLSTKNIFVSLLHYSKDGKFVYRNDFANDMLISVALVQLHDGRLMMALVPVYIAKDRPFISYLFIYSKDGKLISKKKYKDFLINSLYVLPNHQILCGTNKRKGDSYRQTALVVDDQGFKVKEIDLKSRSYIGTLYNDLTKIMKISTGYMLYGGEEIFKLDKNLRLTHRTYLGPHIDRYSEYFVEVAHEDSDGDIHIIGDYGHHSDFLTTMKLNRLKRLNNPMTMEEQLDPVSRKMTRNTTMSIVYDQMIREQEKYNRNRTHGYTGVLLADGSFLTKIKKNDQGDRTSYKGASDPNGGIYFERFNGYQKVQHFLFDQEAKLKKEAQSKQHYCDIKCILSGNKLFYIGRNSKDNTLTFNTLELK